MRPILSILLSALSLSVFAQRADLLQAMPPRLKTAFAKQMAPRDVYKTTGATQRLIGYSYYTGNTQTDTMHAKFSGGRGDAFSNCSDNLMASWGGFAQPDSIWVDDLNLRIVDQVYLYDAQNHATVYTDYRSQSRQEMTYDNSGNNTITKFYDTVGSGNGTLIYKHSQYCFYDNQNRKTYDSIPNQQKSIYIYGSNGYDSIIYYNWHVAAAIWSKIEMEASVYNSLGQKIFYSLGNYDTAAHAWRLYIRDSFIYNSNGFVAEEIDQTNYTGTWTTRKFVTGYSGNNPLPILETEYVGDSLVPDIQDFYSLNSAGNWQSRVSQHWNPTTSSWSNDDSLDIVYNTSEFISMTNDFYYDSTGNRFNTSPSVTQHYYYEDYTPTAVTTIHTTSSEIIAYPNPVSGKLHVDGNIGSKNVSVQMISITGARLFNASGNWQSMNKDIDMSSFANGVYYLLITDNNGNKIAAKQIVKN
ncbi:T9SS type A sorting domain-containing protein [Taibaiella soli]|uniref:Secretion system C-terminal sorting domain-containing protein n=1 Tax=Taibaiella soli TaxID=1649169 RepID=A0A2W2ALW1_9BACT|nr:T9SS type A sorting domain-containing protein [Taibaiella soli]PZF74522.1 hypothetical protein DN068_02805 [Taibaiella soli]